MKIETKLRFAKNCGKTEERHELISTRRKLLIRFLWARYSNLEKQVATQVAEKRHCKDTCKNFELQVTALSGEKQQGYLCYSADSLVQAFERAIDVCNPIGSLRDKQL